MPTESSRPKIKLPDAAYPDIAVIAEHGIHIDAVADYLASVDINSTMLEQAEGISDALGVSREDAAKIVNALRNLDGIRRLEDSEPESFVKAITGSLEEFASEEWRKNHLEDWRKAESHIAVALGKFGPEHPLAIAQKTKRLAYSHQHLLMNAELFTDARPVFNEDGGEIIQFIVTHELAIDFFDGAERRRVHLTMDMEDVMSLRRACERAEQKTETLRREFDKVSWPLFIPPNE